MISVKDLTFQFSNAHLPLFNQINLEIHSNDFIVITGDSGCGKTTLAMALSGFLFSQDKGEFQGIVSIDGIDIRTMSIAEISRKIFLVQQNPENQFCTLTVRDEIAFGLENRGLKPEFIEERIVTALEIVNALDLMDKDLRTLSGGEHQKVAIATAIALKPSLIILDEPTSNLDIPSTINVINMLNKLRKNEDFSLLIIEQKLDQLLSSNPRILSLENGGLEPYDFKSVEQNTSIQINHSHIAFSSQKKQKMVDFCDASISRNGIPILDIEKLEVFENDFISLEGNNGSGKTTLLYSLLGLAQISGLKVQVLGRTIQPKKMSTFNGEIGLVFQNPDHQFFTDSVLKEIKFPIENFSKEDDIESGWIDSLLAAFGLGALRDAHPLRLSYGQKKRLSIASVFSFQPKLLLLDEVFIGQSSRDIKTILEFLVKYIYQFQAAVILVNHLPNIVHNYANRAIILDEGYISSDYSIKKSELKNDSIFSIKRQVEYEN